VDPPLNEVPMMVNPSSGAKENSLNTAWPNVTPGAFVIRSGDEQGVRKSSFCRLSKLHRRWLVANIPGRLGDTRTLQDDGVEVVLTKRSR
jgi:hypothetical protein